MGGLHISSCMKEKEMHSHTKGRINAQERSRVLNGRFQSHFEVSIWKKNLICFGYGQLSLFMVLSLVSYGILRLLFSFIILPFWKLFIPSPLVTFLACISMVLWFPSSFRISCKSTSLQASFLCCLKLWSRNSLIGKF